MSLRRVFPPLGLIMFGITVSIFITELVLRILVANSIGNTNRVLFVEPQQETGWTHPQNFDFHWRGFFPECLEFDNIVHMNNWGFRDDSDWVIEKPENTIRIALFGDSHVEAIQVPNEQTAAQLLEQDLETAFPDIDFEVMNFGVSNYSIGQYQLAYEHFAAQFQPDFVFVYMAYFQFERTLNSFVNGYFTGDTSLNIRPTYQLDADGELEFIPNEDFETYQDIVQSLIEGEFGDDRSIKIAASNPFDGHPSYLYSLITNQVALPASLTSIIYNPHPLIHRGSPDIVFDAVDVNYAILELLNNQVHANNAQLILVDTFSYFERYSQASGSGKLVDQNQSFAEAHGIGYINLSPLFRDTLQSVQFACDGHLNPSGNRIFADAMLSWLETNADISTNP